ncbi:uncharacterized protein LAESUDRAFT_815288 [Laetiporus sulphureus 93-53]|uniref:Uncharacterized protein n=1 Tax=Laetiporus sulphureus 93-53 TaxID=1314785 RepID=A0A165C9H7_9APHY|nr:uncharacterized protein LAESUDRAFT_815288 [Laetiporus sulphureus 93-53]KZT02434.1 hypothetical protein LAESUDRAFT_815288 [Laetiporus sulphureus 93-53]
MAAKFDVESRRDDWGHHRSESSVPLLKEYPDSPQTPTFYIARPRSLLVGTRRRVLVAFASLSALSLIVFGITAILRQQLHPLQAVAEPDTYTNLGENDYVTSSPLDVEVDVPEPESENAYSPYVLGPPTSRFRDNLRNDTKYITSWVSAGWTNDVITYANLIYLGVITGRVPLLPMFTPSHIGGDAGTIAWGDVFDVPRFIRESGIDIVEWRDVKDLSEPEVEDIGCWNVWESVQYREHFPRGSAVPGWLALDVSYTKTPDWVKLISNYEHDQHTTFWTLARLSFPEERERNLGVPLPSPQHQVSLPPDEQLLCFDYLYYLCATQTYEYEYDYSPAWRFVGTHMHWTQDMQNLADAYVLYAFGLPEDAEVPPYIAIHQRHGDFKNYCYEGDPDCFASIEVITRRVREVQDELRVRKGIEIPDTRVIMTSDESDPAWWEEVAAMGWVRIDHDAWETASQYGKWYPVILDAVIQSSAMGFVANDRSTYSTLSRRRVADWQDGATRIVKWGLKDADAH